jgi:large repetitive protein
MFKRVRAASRWEILAVVIAIFGVVSAGCNGGSTTPVPPPPPGASGAMFITDFTNNSISGFGQGANCNCPPALYIHGGNTGLSGPIGIAADKSGNLYVANSIVGTITKYPGTGTGNISPSFAIGGLSQPVGVAVDSSGKLYVANSAASSGVPSVQVYPPGSAAPSQTISGPSTALSTPSFIALDASNNIWVANVSANSVEEFANSATGDVPPANIIAGTRTLLSAPQGIAFDSIGRLYVAINNALGFQDAVLVFGPSASGNVKPLNILCGASTAVNNPTGIAVNSQGTLFVVNSAVALSAGSLVIFAANNIGGGMSCNGSFPNAVVGGPSSTLLNPAGIALH